VAPAFSVDEDLLSVLAGALRSVSYRADDTRELGNAGAIDSAQPATATRRGMVLLTANFVDFRLPIPTTSHCRR
jgi:hypothetical protein